MKLAASRETQLWTPRNHFIFRETVPSGIWATNQENICIQRWRGGGETSWIRDGNETPRIFLQLE